MGQNSKSSVAPESGGGVRGRRQHPKTGRHPVDDCNTLLFTMLSQALLAVVQPVDRLVVLAVDRLVVPSLDSWLGSQR